MKTLKFYFLSFLLIFLFMHFGHQSWSQTRLAPDDVKVDRNGNVKVGAPLSPNRMLDDLSVDFEENVFSECLEGEYYLAFQLVYDFGDQNTQTEWEASVDVALYQNGNYLWTETLSLDMAGQTFITTVFHEEIIECDENYTYKIESIDITGAAPGSNIHLFRKLYKKDELFNVYEVPESLTSTEGSVTNEYNLTWQHTGQGVVEYELQWVYIDDQDTREITTSTEAFSNKEPVSLILEETSTNLLLYYPQGTVYLRVRAIGFNPDYPEYSVPGVWSAGSSIDISNHNSGKTWQIVSTYAEDGKTKKVIQYLDGGLRNRQTLTNLNTDETTLIAKNLYDFEGRPSVSMLPYPEKGKSLDYRSTTDQFSIPEEWTGSTKYLYDNGTQLNAALDDAKGASKYYSPDHETGINTYNEDYVPDADGYVYSQTQYLNDGTGRIRKQSGVGEEFFIDNGKNTKYYYATPPQAELTRLFGSNVGNATHYSKNAVVDPNGQVSINYLDQEDRTIATALADENPNNLDPLPSLEGTEWEEVTVGILEEPTKEGNEYKTVHKFLNTAKGAVDYKIDYSINFGGFDDEELGCEYCNYELEIFVLDGNNELLSLDENTDNESDDPHYFRRSFSSNDCSDVGENYSIESVHVTLPETGEYTIVKTIRAEEYDYDVLEHFVENAPTYATEIQQIRDSYVVDPEDCDICVGCDEIDEESLIEEAIEKAAEFDCENIKNAIYARLKAEKEANGDFSEVEDSEVDQDEDICEYNLCIYNKESDKFDKRLYTIESWSDAVALGYDELVEEDPFFTSGLSGDGYKSEFIEDYLNTYEISYQIPILGGDAMQTITLTGNIRDLVDETNTEFFINQNGQKDAGGFHVLYSDDVLAENSVDFLKWSYYRGFYLELKRQFKKTEVNAYTGCEAAMETLRQLDDLPKDEEDILDYGREKGFIGPVSDVEIENTIISLEAVCGITIPEGSDRTAIAEYLRAYFDKDQNDLLNVINIEDLSTDEDLAEINTILSNLSDGSCSLTDIAVDELFNCEAPIIIDLPTGFVDDLLSYSQNEESFVGYGNHQLSMTSENQNFLPAVSSAEYEALMDLYYMSVPIGLYNGRYWNNNDGWSDADPNMPEDVSTWYGITVEYVDGGYHVTELDLSNNNLIGVLPASIDDLNYLKSLNLSNNTLRGVLPPELLGGIPDLEFVDLSYNHLSGTVPSPPVFSDLDQLTYINLSNNYFDNVEDFISSNAVQSLIVGCFGLDPHVILLSENAIDPLSISSINSTYISLKNCSNIDLELFPAKQTGNYSRIKTGLNTTVTLSTPSIPSFYTYKYQWYKDGEDISDLSNDPEIEVSIDDINDYGLYYCRLIGGSDDDYPLVFYTNYIEIIPTTVCSENLIANSEYNRLALRYYRPPNSSSSIYKLTGTAWKNLYGGVTDKNNIRMENRECSADIIQGTMVNPLQTTKEYALTFKYKSSYDGMKLSIALSNDEFEISPYGPDGPCNSSVILLDGGINYEYVEPDLGSESFLLNSYELQYTSNEYRQISVVFKVRNPGVEYIGIGVEYPSGTNLKEIEISDLKIREVAYCDPGDVPTEPVEVCRGYGTGGWTEYQREIDYDRARDLCLASLDQQISILREEAVDKYIEEKVSELYNNYTKNCFETVSEEFTYTYSPKEYHYTLYYYDQAGNLVQTVPPEGVKPLSKEQVEDHFDDNPENDLEPPHKLKTHYGYNSLNQLVWQRSPDGGLSKFWYNDKGQLRLSQNAEQRVTDKYSFTLYDLQGRISTSGEIIIDSSEDILELANDDVFPSGYYNDPEEIKNIVAYAYDYPVGGMLFNAEDQENARGRLSAALTSPSLNILSPEMFATGYSYDAHGNVKTILYSSLNIDDKRIDYIYDQVSGNVNYVFYQYGEPDQFMHKYTYDADNRLSKVETSHDGYSWNEEARYFYYAHGPLAKVELGEYKVQSIDYYYTLQGWLKGINNPLENDPNGDGTLASMRGKDEFALALGYFDGDYSPVGSEVSLPDSRDQLWTRHNEIRSSDGLYNGNISWMATHLPEVGRKNTDDPSAGYQAMVYGYDQLNRIKEAKSLTNYTPGSGFDPRPDEKTPFDASYSYDANGNLSTLQRNDDDGNLMHDLNYEYIEGTNQLLKTGDSYEKAVSLLKVYDENPIVDDGVLYQQIIVEGTALLPAGNAAELKATKSVEIKPGFEVESGATFSAEAVSAETVDVSEGQYEYDLIGNLIRDKGEGTSIEWTPYGKVKDVTKDNGDITEFLYDANGNRWFKSVTIGEETKVTYYIRDASGNVMATYDENEELTDQFVYGSSRLGKYLGGAEPGKEKLGLRNYELTNHLGNVMAVISDRINIIPESTDDDSGAGGPPGDPNGGEDPFGGPPTGGGPGGGADPDAVADANILADVISVSDYYPFGLQMNGRTFSADTYRYGFNGKEKDDNGEWGQTHYDYGFRIYNPSIAKFLSVDPLSPEYPMYTPYQFSANTPIAAIDLDGAEAFIKITAKYWEDEIKNKINNNNDIESAIRLAFKASRQITLEDLKTADARNYAQGDGGWVNGRPATFNYVDSKFGGIVIMGPNDELLFARVYLKEEDNSSNFKEGGGGIQFTFRGSGLSEPGVHVRKGNAESFIEINDLLNVIGMAGNASKGMGSSKLKAKDIMERLKYIFINEQSLDEFSKNLNEIIEYRKKYYITDPIVEYTGPHLMEKRDDGTYLPIRPATLEDSLKLGIK